MERTFIMGKTKEVLFGYTSLDMMLLSCTLVKDPDAAAIPYYSGKKNKIKSIKLNKRNMADCKIHFVNFKHQTDNKCVLVDPDGNVVKRTKIKIGKKTGMGYTISLKGLKENINAYINDSSPVDEHIYSFKVIDSNRLLFVWDCCPEYDMFIELNNGNFIEIYTPM